MINVGNQILFTASRTKSLIVVNFCTFDDSSLHVYKLCSNFTDYVLVKNKKDKNIVSKKVFCFVLLQMLSS